MVGVPRSKGCITCRRRKVACSQEKPTCNTCQRRGIPCEGYAHGPTVLQWTPTGLAPRQRFDDAPGIAAGPSAARTTVPMGNDGILLPLQVNASGMMLEQIEVRCLETYLPRRGAVAQEVKGTWMYSILEIPDLGRTLSLAFAALSLARVGLVNNDQDIASESRNQYSSALVSLQDALNRPELAFQDRTLAAMRTLSIYEHLSPTFAPTPPGRVHEEGLEKWCVAAGPQSINSPFALQTFQDVRWCIMGHCLGSRTSSVLGSEEWKTVPWQNVSLDKDSLQQLYDIGFDLAAVLEQTDRLLQSNTTPAQENFAALWQSCLSIFSHLEDWYKQHWPNRSSLVPDNSHAEAPNTSIGMQFANFWEATNIVYFWTFKLLLDQNVLALSQSQNQLPQPTASSRSMPSSSRSKAVSTPQNTSLVTHGLTPSQAEQIAATSLQLASDIVASAPFFLAEDTGWLGPQRLFFPLRQVMGYYGKIQSPKIGEAKAAFFACLGRLRTGCADKN